MDSANTTSNRPRRRRRSKAARRLVPPDDHASTSPPRHVDSDVERERQQVVEKEAKEEEEKQTLEWLMGAFSSSSLGEVEAACREAEWDAYRAAGLLAGRELESRGEEGRRRRKKEKAKVTATGIVSDVIGKGYGKAVEGANGEGENKNKMEMEEFLFGMMGDGCELDVGLLRDVLGQCGYDLEKALDMLLDISSFTGSRFRNYSNDDCMSHSKKHVDMIQEGLAADYNNMEDKFSDKTATSSSGTSDNDPDNQYPASCNFGNEACRMCIPKEQRSSLSWANKQELEKKVLLSLFSIPDSSQREPKLMNWKKVVKKMESFGQGLEFSVGPSNDANSRMANEIAKEDIYHTFHGAAKQHWDTMKSYYQRAAVMYSKGERAHASYLSEKGRYFSKLAREADEKAGREIFEARNKDIQNEITIDLHGQHVKQAMGLLKLHLLIFTYTPSIQILRVITGCGSHGVGKGKLKQSVIKLAEREGIHWREENAGTILMKIDTSKVYSFVEDDDDDLE